MKSEKLTLSPGDILFREGEASNGLYLVEQGNIEIVRIRKNTEVVLSTLRQGEVLGTVTYLTGEPRTATARAKDRCVISFFAIKQLHEGMKEIPVWAQAILKDTIRRLKVADDAIVEAAENERRLKMEVGNLFTHSAQLAFLLSVFMRKGTIVDDMNTNIFPMKDFLVNAEFVLFRKFYYWEKILHAFTLHRLIKIDPNQKYTKVISNPNPQFLEDFGHYAIDVSKKGTRDFTPIRYHKWLTTLLTLSRKYNKIETIEKSRIKDYFEKEANMKDETEDMLTDLSPYRLLTDKGTSVNFSYEKIQKTIIFENTLREIKEIEI